MKNIKLNFIFTAISLVLVAIFIGACSDTPATSNNSKSTANSKVDADKKWAETVSKAPQGAVPPNSKGAPNALVTIEEFADFQCPTCGSMHPKVQEIRAAFGDRIRIIYRQFPLQMHQYGYDAACAAEAAGLQGKFWDMQNKLFTNQAAWSNATDARKIFTDYATELGLDAAKFSDDMIGLAVKNRVDADLQRGRALGVSSTPTFYINNRPYEGDLNSLRTAIDAELKKAEGGQVQSAGQAQSSGTTASNTTATNTVTNVANTAANTKK
jgi:protein-disulfide isomerase